MDRESFPTLTESTTGWPVFHVPLDIRGAMLHIEVVENNDYPQKHDIRITTEKLGPGMLSVTVDGNEVLSAFDGHPWPAAEDL